MILIGWKKVLSVFHIFFLLSNDISYAIVFPAVAGFFNIIKT